MFIDEFMLGYFNKTHISINIILTFDN